MFPISSQKSRTYAAMSLFSTCVHSLAHNASLVFSQAVVVVDDVCRSSSSSSSYRRTHSQFIIYYCKAWQIASSHYVRKPPQAHNECATRFIHGFIIIYVLQQNCVSNESLRLTIERSRLLQCAIGAIVQTHHADTTGCLIHLLTDWLTVTTNACSCAFHFVGAE